ncbi:MAG TPA: MFS transporter [Chthoniobacteraceae bacterium]|jgi:MFS family permease|nr:MFS transporter [Chthoniobacteraceae bacterium]
MSERRFPAISQAWLTVLLLWPVAMLNYLDRQIFSTMKASIMADVVDIRTEAAFGSLMSAFLYGYGVMSLLGGYLGDRFNRRWVILGSLGLWSLVTWLTGRAQTYEQLWWARSIMGLSEACYIPAGLAMIADFHGAATRSRAVGIHQSGIKMGIILGGMGGYIADSHYGWRAGFEWCGAAGVLYAILLFFCLRNPPRDDAALAKKQGLALWPSLRELFGLAGFLLLLLYVTLPAVPNWVVKSWMPAVLASAFHLQQGQAGSSATLSVMFGSFAGLGLGGWLADRWQQRSARGRIYVSSLGLACCIPALVAIGAAPNLGVAVVFLVLFGIGWGFYDANNMPILCQVVRPELRATGFGIMNMVSVLIGGYAVDLVGKMRDAGEPQSLMFNLCALAAAGAVAIILSVRVKPATP